MKRKLLLFNALFLCVHYLSFAQQAFFWAGNDKINLTADSSQLLLKVRNANAVNQLVTGLERTGNQPGLLNIGGISFVLIKNNQAKGLVIDNTVVEFKQYVYYRENLPYFFNGAILLKPKKGISINTIIQQFSNDVTLTGSLSSGTYFLKANQGEKVLSVSNTIAESGLVEWCQPDFKAEIKKYIIPTDPTFNEQYYLNNTGQFGGTAGVDINAPEAWDVTLGCNTIRIAVIDDGVENHDELQGRVLQGFSVLDANGFGRPNAVCNGIDRVGHGMACTGIIAASHNTIGVAGVAPNSLIYPVNIFVGGETIGDLATSMNRAWDPNFGNADVISNSWGFPNTTGPVGAIALTNEITAARTTGRVRNGVTLGCVVVFASGNNNPGGGCVFCFNGVSYPANVDGVITVGAIDNVGNIHNYSSRGAGMDLVAPSGGANGNPQLGGCNIPSGNVRTIDRPGANGYDAGDFFAGFNGTSAAAPQVAGVAALMLSANPNLTEAQVLAFFQQTATDMGAGGYDDTFGFGRVNAEAAVKRALGRSINGPGLICSNGTFSLDQPIPGTVNWSTSNSNGLVIDGNGFATRVGNFNGLVDILASTANGCGSIRRTVYVGAPNLTKTINGNTNSTVPVSAGFGYSLQASSSSPNTSFNYNDSFGYGDISITIYNPNDANTGMYVSGNSTFGNRHVDVTATNACGSYQEDFVFYLYSGYRVASNPAKDNMTVIFDDASYQESLPDQLELLSEKEGKPLQTVNIKDMFANKSFKEGNQVVFDIRNYPRGIYYLRVINPRQTDDKKIEVIRVAFE